MIGLAGDLAVVAAAAADADAAAADVAAAAAEAAASADLALEAVSSAAAGRYLSGWLLDGVGGFAEAAS